MGGASFIFTSDELFTRAKKPIIHSHHVLGFAQYPEGCLPSTGADIESISWAPQVYLAFTVQTVYIQ